MMTCYGGLAFFLNWSAWVLSVMMELILEVFDVWASSDVAVVIGIAYALTLRVVCVDAVNYMSCGRAFEVMALVLHQLL